MPIVFFQLTLIIILRLHLYLCVYVNARINSEHNYMCVHIYIYIYVVTHVGSIDLYEHVWLCPIGVSIFPKMSSTVSRLLRAGINFEVFLVCH